MGKPRARAAFGSGAAGKERTRGVRRVASIPLSYIPLNKSIKHIFTTGKEEGKEKKKNNKAGKEESAGKEKYGFNPLQSDTNDNRGAAFQAALYRCPRTWERCGRRAGRCGSGQR